MIIIRPLIKVLSKIMELPKGSFLDPTTLGSGNPDGTNFLRGDSTWADPLAGAGTVTSVGLTMPTAFAVANSPVTSAGTLAVTATGLASQYIRGDGELATLPTSGGGGNNVNYYLNGGTAASVATYFQMSKAAVIGTGVDFSKAGNGLISQWLTDVGDPNVTEIPAGNWNFEMFFSASSAGGVPKFYIEILKYSGGIFTSISNNSLAPESITSGVAIDLYLCSVAVPLTSLAVGDRIALRVYIVDSVGGRTITQHTQDSHLCQVITTFSSGLSSINGLTSQTQYLAVGTSGTDFAINSATDTHTFNLPTASATNRGALSTSDWSAFNGKQAALISGTNIKTINTISLLGSGDITIGGGGGGIAVGTTAVTSGTIGRVFFQATGDVVQQSANLFWDNTNGRLNLGAVGTNSARLDIKAPGALSTDIAFRVRNSADSATILQVNGVGQVWANGKGFQSQNTAFGQLSLNSCTTGNNNTAFGYNSLAAVTTATTNTGYGSGTLQLTTGEGNTAVGFNSGRLITTGTYNTCIGYEAGSNGAPTSGVYIGYSPGLTSTGSNVVAIGSVAAQGLTSGSGGVAIGNSARIGTTGSHNISFGQSSGLGLTTGSFNIHLGYRSVGSGVATGNYNTLIGGDSVIGDVSNNAILSDAQGNQAIRKDTNHNVLLGREVALATNATNGFAYLPTCAGVPTGVPAASFTGKAPVVIDSTNNKMYIYTNATWVALN